VTELERDFTFSLTKYPSLIFVFLVVIQEISENKGWKNNKKKTLGGPHDIMLVYLGGLKSNWQKRKETHDIASSKYYQHIL